MNLVLLRVILLVTSVLLCLVLVWFIQPDLLYPLRRALIKVRLNRVFMEYQRARKRGADLPALLREDIRLHTSSSEPDYILHRALKLRELYRSIDEAEGSGSPRHRDARGTSVCLIELAGLIENFARTASESNRYVGSVTHATTLLRFIIDRARNDAGESRLTDEEDVELWLRNHPLRLEQMVELLIATVYALVLRETALKEHDGTPMTAQSRGVWEAILLMEKRMRQSLRKTLETDGIAGGAVDEYLATSGLSVEVLNRAVSKRERERKRLLRQDVGDLLEYLYIDDLMQLIFKEWNRLRLVYEDKTWLRERIEKILPVRNAAAHGRLDSIDRADLKVAHGYAQQITRRIEAQL